LPKKTTAIITEKKCDYIIGVKKNQPTLYRQIQEAFENNELIDSCMIEMQKNKGRAEIRKIRVSNAIDKMHKSWEGLCQVVEVNRMINAKGKTSMETSYYISSKKTNAWEYLEGIRNHWSIEMGLHYVKDVTLKEDTSKIISANAPGTISFLKSISINLIRGLGFKNIPSGLRLLCNDIHRMLNAMLI
jgi:predicted transposase YbfD/YdcC